MIGPAAGLLPLAGKILGGLGTAYTVYEGAKMIPYFTDSDSVLNDLAEKPERKITGKRELNPLDQFRMWTSDFKNQYGQYMVPEQYGGIGLSEGDAIERLLDETKEASEKRLSDAETKKQVRGARRKVEVEEAGLSEYDRDLRGLQKQLTQDQIDGLADERQFRADTFNEQKAANVRAAESRLAEILALQAGNEGNQNVALAELG
ncbi:MAG: hypothetical protein GY918_11255, partial [Gammaproteobacteria bacterium]|nr:hypothetical protein [Gammaproteobacteria bacterium]